jgi:nucleoside 2-deoxyribosyltransferase
MHNALLMIEAEKNKKNNPKVISWIRDLYERGAAPPEITAEILENIKNNLPDYIPTQKSLILLRNIARKTSFPGDCVLLIPDRDYPLAWAANEDELIYYLKSLVERKLLVTTKGHSEISKLTDVVEITAAGWEFLEKNETAIIASNQAFVAMSFSPELNSIWTDAIKKGIENAGYSAYRIDVKPHADRIDTKIMTEIKNSRFLVADVTEQRQGVYFEAGYALGLGLPVIWSCRKDDFKNAHFDTRQYNHIVWEKPEELKENLYNFICAIIGKISKSQTLPR